MPVAIAGFPKMNQIAQYTLHNTKENQEITENPTVRRVYLATFKNNKLDISLYLDWRQSSYTEPPLIYEQTAGETQLVKAKYDCPCATWT